MDPGRTDWCNQVHRYLVLIIDHMQAYMHKGAGGKTPGGGGATGQIFLPSFANPEAKH